MKFLLVAVSAVAAAAVLTAGPEDQAFQDDPGEALANDHNQMKGRHISVASVSRNSDFLDADFLDDGMEMLLGRSRWCRRRNGLCRNPRKHSCGSGYRESPMGRPYCMGKKRRCCYPVETTVVSTTIVATTTTTSASVCPSNYTNYLPTNQCFKAFEDRRRTFTEADAKCRNYGMVLAKVNDPIPLRSYLITTIGLTYNTWVGAQGNGSIFLWEQDGETISNSSPLWYPGNPGVKTSSRYCIKFLTMSHNMARYPNMTYFSQECDGVYNTLCELII